MKKALWSIAAATLIILTGCSNAATPIQAEDRPPLPVVETVPEPAGPVERDPVESEPLVESAPPAVDEPAEPTVNIDHWISYAQEYAKSSGLNLDTTAVDCWDNPITAGAHCTCLERDIESRLNRYAKDETILDV